MFLPAPEQQVAGEAEREPSDGVGVGQGATCCLRRARFRRRPLSRLADRSVEPLRNCP